jgi:hypothetical protein
MTETVMHKMETWTNVIGEYRYIILLRCHSMNRRFFIYANSFQFSP